jgi:hypothetical protein
MEEEMINLVEKYKSNEERSDKLHRKLIKLLDYNTKVTANYGLNPGGSKGTVSSKVERHVMKIRETEEKILAIEDKLYKVNQAEKVLNNKEKEIIDLIKSGNYEYKETTKIAKAINQDKKYVYDTRNRAIKKMSEYIKGEVWKKIKY